MINTRTSRGYQLPHPENIAKYDVVRIRESFMQIDADLNHVEAFCNEAKSTADKEKFEEFIGLWSKK